MNFLKIVYSYFRRFEFSLLFATAFALWVFCFKGFVFGELRFVSDAVSYYDQIRYFIENFERGVFPLWEPLFGDGVPFGFFLQRIGAYNPFFLLIIFFRKVGLPHTIAYTLFLSIYYFIGTIGFYLLAKRITGDRLSAFVCFVLLLFSSLGTRLFDSFILLTIIPMVWFFYFLISFLKTPRTLYMVGATTTLMILLTTYIPFFFLNIFLTSVLVLGIVYGQRINDTFCCVINYARGYKIRVAVCLACVLLSAMPGVSTLLGSKDSDVVLPQRHNATEDASFVAVGIQTSKSWGIEEDLAYSFAYSDAELFKFAVFYVPVFALLLALQGVMLPLNRKLIGLFFFCAALLICFSHRLPVYEFLHEHVFYFKYFRNLHFYLWMAILPGAILFLGEQFRMLRSKERETGKIRAVYFIFMILIHVGAGVYLIQRSGTHWVTFFTIFLSAVFWGMCYAGFLKKNRWIFWILLAFIALEPLVMYGYLQKNALKAEGLDIYRYKGQRPYMNFDLWSREKRDNELFHVGANVDGDIMDALGVFDPGGYYRSRWSLGLLRNIERSFVQLYRSARLILYDHVEPLVTDDTFQLLAAPLVLFKNIAYVDSAFDHSELGHFLDNVDQPRKTQADIVVAGDQRVTVLSYDVNHVKLRTRLENARFLVMTQTYDGEWRVNIDGKEAKNFRANYAFNGVFVPAGDHVVEFRYGASWKYAMHYSLLVLTWGMFAVLLVLAGRWKDDDENA